MSSEPPSDTGPVQDEDVAAHVPGSEALNGPTGGQMRSRWGSVGAVVAALAIAGIVGLSLFHAQGSHRQQEHSALARGLACPHLLAAADAYARGDRIAFDQEIAQAAKGAEETLQKSGQLFGKPERIALQLHLAPAESPARVKAMLQLATRECQ
jgi:hypothetical protein